MITRIVKVKLKCQFRDDFLAFMNDFRHSARMIKENHHVDFFNDLEDTCDFHVYTIWKTKKALNTFMKSELNRSFKENLNKWSEKPYAAWTVENV
jgi:hypothetical protein